MTTLCIHALEALNHGSIEFNLVENDHAGRPMAHTPKSALEAPWKLPYITFDKVEIVADYPYTLPGTLVDQIFLHVTDHAEVCLRVPLEAMAAQPYANLYDIIDGMQRHGFVAIEMNCAIEFWHGFRIQFKKGEIGQSIPVPSVFVPSRQEDWNKVHLVQRY